MFRAFMIKFIVFFETICSVEEFVTDFTPSRAAAGDKTSIAEGADIRGCVLNVLVGARTGGSLNYC